MTYDKVMIDMSQFFLSLISTCTIFLRDRSIVNYQAGETPQLCPVETSSTTTCPGHGNVLPFVVTEFLKHLDNFILIRKGHIPARKTDG